MLKKLEVSAGFVLLIAVMGLTDRNDILLLTLLSMSVHELGHIISLRLLGYEISKINLKITGASIETGSLMSCGDEILAALAGPLAGAFMTLLGIAAGSDFLAGVNILLCAFNLLPVYPLDGGRILRAIINMRAPNAKIERLFAASALIMSAALFLYVTFTYGFNLMTLCVLILLCYQIFQRKL